MLSNEDFQPLVEVYSMNDEYRKLELKYFALGHDATLKERYDLQDEMIALWNEINEKERNDSQA